MPFFCSLGVQQCQLQGSAEGSRRRLQLCPKAMGEAEWRTLRGTAGPESWEGSIQLSQGSPWMMIPDFPGGSARVAADLPRGGAAGGLASQPKLAFICFVFFFFYFGGPLEPCLTSTAGNNPVGFPLLGIGSGLSLWSSRQGLGFSLPCCL